jgi:UDPglucose--hexose-1-phosphate uridylyltransferase
MERRRRMSELRQNPATEEWVVVAPERLKGQPLQPDTNPPAGDQPVYDEDCPFCPGNEHRFENQLIEAIGREGEPVAQDDWEVRVIHNKYEIVSMEPGCEEPPREFEQVGLYNRLQACGNHELVIENRAHNKTIATMDHDEVMNVLRLYRSRFQALSQLHPHTQVVGMRVVPNHIRLLLEQARRHFDSHGCCVFCRMTRFEREQGVRMVYENDRFVAYVPFAAANPHELWILPRRHDALFGDMDRDEMSHLADCLRACMGKLYRALSNPDFNLILRNPPFALSGVPYYHWHLLVIPMLRATGGFERGARIQVNLVPPEQSAADLRDA